jgi:hypothetical protein
VFAFVHLRTWFACTLLHLEGIPHHRLTSRHAACSALFLRPTPHCCIARVALLCRYTDPDGQSTESYPFNPNGSPLGIAALTSENGRHLAMMPHPERCFLTWQLPWWVVDGVGGQAHQWRAHVSRQSVGLPIVSLLVCPQAGNLA